MIRFQPHMQHSSWVVASLHSIFCFYTLPPPHTPAGPRIFVGKLGKETSEQDVKDYFIKFGYVMDVYLPRGGRRANAVLSPASQHSAAWKRVWKGEGSKWQRVQRAKLSALFLASVLLLLSASGCLNVRR